MSEPLSAAQLKALACVLDAIIPPSADGRLPGAGRLGLEHALSATPRPALVSGLDALDALARERGAAGFADLPVDRRTDALNALGSHAPAFLPALVAQTYATYYRHPRVVEALGLEARPPYPGGHVLEPTDFSILGPVRDRAPFYREP